MSMGGEPLQFEWDALVPRLVHPMRVQVIEALCWIGEPLSVTDLSKVFGERSGVPLIAYHVGKLAQRWERSRRCASGRCAAPSRSSSSSHEAHRHSQAARRAA